MSGSVASLWRHPIKAHGFEALQRVTLDADRTVPFDRAWAVAQAGGKLDGGSWVPCGNFSRGALAPALMAISAQLDAAGEVLTLSHPDLPALTFRPDTEAEAFLDWVRPISLDGARAPAALIRATERGMTDSDFPSVALLNRASLRALGQSMGRDLREERFRGNIWLDGFGPWEEFDWIGQRLRCGDAVIEIRERITRCKATMVDPDTGRRDADTLGALEAGWGHSDFGVYGVVVGGGTVAVGDTAVPT